jgi:hypothetical protein
MSESSGQPVSGTRAPGARDHPPRRIARLRIEQSGYQVTMATFA